MPRRSARLQEKGYYGSDNKPVTCYKETCRVFKKLKGGFHARFDTLPDTYPDVPLDVPSGTYPDVPLDVPSGTRSSETSPANRPWRMLMFILFLCLGLFVTLTVHTEFSTNAVTKVSSGNSEGVWKHLKELQVKELQEEVKELQEEVKELQEKAKERQEELKEHQEKMKKLKEEVEELKEKMEFLHPLADRLPNFALESLGAKITTNRAPYPPNTGLSLFGFQLMDPIWPPPVSPRILLQGLAPTTPGQCWAFKSTWGRVTFELPYSITVSHVSIGHIPENISPLENISSAPRMFSVLGQKNKDGPEIFLGTFEYDIEGRPLQTFEITGHDTTVVKFLILFLRENWGNEDYTCIYSFRVHGKMAAP